MSYLVAPGAPSEVRRGSGRACTGRDRHDEAHPVRSYEAPAPSEREGATCSDGREREAVVEHRVR